MIFRNIIGSALLATILVIMGFLSLKKSPPVPAQFTLFISPEGVLAETVSMMSLKDVLHPGKQGQVPVAYYVDLLTHAATDGRVMQIVLDLSNFSADGLGPVSELYHALKFVKNSGKSVHVFSESYSDTTYLLASVADSIWLDSFGSVDISGFSISHLYFREALDKYGIEPHYVRAGIYKSALEPIIASQMSEESRAMNTSLIQSAWLYYRSQVAVNRKIEETLVDDYSQNFVTLLAAQSEQSTALLALEQGLVQHVGTMKEMLNEVSPTVEIDLFGIPGKNAELLVSDSQYSAEIAHRRAKEMNKQPIIGLIYASGEIRRGASSPGVLGSQTLIQAVEQAVNSGVAALVIRMDSPGGDAYASEEVYRVLMAVREKAGIPIVLSVGSVAASGAYWIGLAVDKIVAHELSLTGSIGVFSFMVSAPDLSRQWGITSDSVATHNRRLGGTIADRVNPELLAMNQTSVNFIYNNFLDRMVMAERATTREEADKLAQGRVYSAQEALDLGLVDQLGILEDAVILAAQLAEVKTWQVQEYQPALSMIDKIVAIIATQPTTSLEQLMGYWTKQEQMQAIDLTQLSIR